jgi:hypothetical protein
VLGGVEGDVPERARVHIVRLAAPPAATVRFAAWGGGREMNDDGVRRWWNPVSHEFGGYELRVAPIGNGQFELRIRPLGAALEGFRRFELPRPVAPTVVRPGEPVEVDLARDGDARLFDRIEVLRAVP